MDPQIFIALIQNHLPYLFRQYGFNVIHQEYYPEHSGNALVVLQARDARVRFIYERGQVFIDVGPLTAPQEWKDSTPNQWFDLVTLTAFLSQGQDRWQYGTGEVDAQLQTLSAKFKPYADRIFDLFKPANFLKTQKELIAYADKLAQERWGQFKA